MRVEKWIVRGLGEYYKTQQDMRMWVYSADGRTFSFMSLGLDKSPPDSYQNMPLAGILDFETGDVLGTTEDKKDRRRWWKWLRIAVKVFIVTIVLGIWLFLALCGDTKHWGHVGTSGSRRS